MTNLLSATLIVLRVFVETNLVHLPPAPGTEFHPIYTQPLPAVVTNYVIGIRLDGTNTLELLTAQKRGPYVLSMYSDFITNNVVWTNISSPWWLKIPN